MQILILLYKVLCPIGFSKLTVDLSKTELYLPYFAYRLGGGGRGGIEFCAYKMRLQGYSLNFWCVSSMGV